MKIKSFLLFALHALLLSYTLAVDTSKQETTTKKAKEAAEPKEVQAKGDEEKYGVNYGGGGGNYGGGGGNYGGGGGGSGWGGGCHHGCCYRGHGGSCNRCCASPEEAKAFAENQSKGKEAADSSKVEPKGEGVKYDVNYGGGGGGGGNYGGGGGNYGGGGGGGCHHGCCYRGYGGNCNRCCASPEEAKAFAEKQSQTKEKQSEAKESADANKVEPKGDGGKYGVNYGGGGGGGNYGGGGGNYGGGGGGGCHHGCCYRGHGGSCNRCCFSPEEAKAFAESQSHP